jgi:hypothetical protein
MIVIKHFDITATPPTTPRRSLNILVVVGRQHWLQLLLCLLPTTHDNMHFDICANLGVILRIGTAC